MDTIEEAIFHAASELNDPQARGAFLDRACGADGLLRARLDALLQADLRASQFLSQDPLEFGANAGKPPSRASAPPYEPTGTVIGRYKLLEKIGEGGMGVVYMAQQEEPVRRRVALKIIKLGMDTQQVVARFEAERQALALMHHPNIAKVLDGGATDTGRPYFVMELVPGVPITEFCDKNHFSAEERVQLFIPVCQAIQSAHQKGVIHRDLKPSNILVTLNDGVPMPMVIDFGVAKATQQKLTEKTLFTQYSAMIGTPAYMSPEQAEMTRLDVDTRSDIYGLGVLLYELLTGTTPFPEKRLRSASYQEMQRIILEEEPDRPSTRLRQKSVATPRSPLVTGHWSLATDLDWIVMKCLEKDRARRYETANGLAADLKRHLDNELVVARPPSTAYRLQKAWRRNKVAFTAAAAVVAALVVGTAVSTWQAIEASTARNGEREQRLVAQTERDKAQAGQKEAERAQQAEKQQHLRADHLLYLADMSQAQQAWEQNNIGRLQQSLEETRGSPDRGFEWYYWQAQTHLSLSTLRGHLEGVTSVAFSPDGQRIVTGSDDQTAKVWDAANGKELLTLRGHGSAIHSVAFSPDGQRIVTGSDGGTAKLSDAASGKELLTIPGHRSAIHSVTFSPDGQRIVTGSVDMTAKVWDAANGNELLALKGHDDKINDVAYCPDGQRIVTGSDDHTAKVWEAAGGTNLLTLKGHTASIWSVGFSQNGQRIVTGSYDQTAKVWDASSGTNLLTLPGHSDGIESVAFSHDGQWIVTGSWDGTAKVWNAASGKELLTIKGHSDRVRGVAFSPDGQRIVTGSRDGTAKVWERASVKGILTLRGHSDAIFSVAFSPNGERIVTGSWDGTARVWEASSGKELLSLTNHGTEIPSGLIALYRKGHRARVYSAAFSPDGRRIVTGSSQGTAKVWDAASGRELRTLTGHSDWILSAAFSPDGQRIITGSGYRTAGIWDAASGLELFTLAGHSDEVWSVAFSPDGQRVVTGSFDQTAKVWDVASKRPLFKLDKANGRFLSVAFSPDCQRIVTGGDDGTAKLWETASGRELLTLKGHSGEIWSVAFSPDGQRIVTGSRDQTAKVWEAARAEQVAEWNQQDEQAKIYDQLKPGSAFAGDGNIAEAEQLLTGLLTNANYPAALTVRMLKLRANVCARSGQWLQAAADLSRAIEKDPGDYQLWFWLGAIDVQGGQLEAYRKHCRQSLERFAQTTEPFLADGVAKDSLILPGSGINLDTVGTMADTAVAQGRDSEYFPYFQFCKGLAEYRQNRFTSAADWMETVLTNRVNSLPPATGASMVTGAYMVLAMSQHQLQQIEQARASLAKGTEFEQKLPKLESGDIGEGWADWVIAHALMSEAKALIEAQPATAAHNSP
jgi:WD40 repeat protein